MTLKLIRLDHTRQNADGIQRVLENAPDYFIKITGEKARPNDGEEVFKALPENFERDAKHVLGIYLEDELVGVIDCLIGFPDNNKAHIGLLLLVENFQRKGIGSKVYSELEKYLEQFPRIDNLRLSVIETNDQVVSFWERCGFIKTDITKPYANKKIISRSIIMEKLFR